MEKIKFYYNGFKVEGGKLQRYWISNGQRVDGRKGFTIYGRDYEGFSEEIRNAFNVVNNTEIQTDYFEKDRIFVEENTPYYNEVKQAFEKSQAHNKTARKVA